jgi:hypothetical protein
VPLSSWKLKNQESFQHLKCIEAKNTLSAPESTLLAAGIKKFDQKLLNHMKCVFNTAYYISKYNKPYH